MPKVYLGFLVDLGEDSFVLRLTVPGVVSWKHEGKTSRCAAAFEESFPKKDWSRDEVVNIGKNICKLHKWVWDDVYGPNGVEERIDYGEEKS